jgi:hypothetical protein
MYFVLIVMNIFSLMHVLLDYRLWSVNKDINMRNEAWSEMDRTYKKKSSEKHFRDKNYGQQYWDLFTLL